MSTEKIFGGWDSLPSYGKVDDISMLWHKLAAQNVGSPSQKDNFGLTQRRGEWTMLMELYLRSKPKVVVEIGVAQSGTAAGWCVMGQPDATIIFIDRCLDDSRPRPGDPGNSDIYSGQLKMFSRGGGVLSLKRESQTVIGLNGWSYDDHILIALKNILGERKIDWLWTDSSHEASMFQKEFDMYWPLVSEGGVYCTHDIQRSSHPQVTKWEVWDRLKDTIDYSMVMEFKGGRNDDSYGVGALIR